MNLKKSNPFLHFVLVGLILCFILKNLFSILNNSYGGDPIYIISNPSIDEELWWILGLCYLFTTKVFFKDYFDLVLSQLMKNKIIKIVIDFYFSFHQGKFFRIMVRVVLFLLTLVTIGLTFNLLDSNKMIDILNWFLFLYLTFIFNKNFRIVGK